MQHSGTGTHCLWVWPTPFLNSSSHQTTGANQREINFGAISGSVFYFLEIGQKQIRKNYQETWTVPCLTIQDFFLTRQIFPVLQNCSASDLCQVPSAFQQCSCESALDYLPLFLLKTNTEKSPVVSYTDFQFDCLISCSHSLS